MKKPFYILTDKHVIQQKLLAWFSANQRDFPWRLTYDSYQVWISEIMGQQTQMDRVVVYFKRWIRQFPDVAAVAGATEQEILKAWEGLGYYSRAKNIQRTARVLVNDYGGRIPADLNDLLGLPGIGPYTAAAILSIAYNKPSPLLDANVERLFSRLLDLDHPVKKAPAPAGLRMLAGDLLPEGRARLFNQALMEFGALVCRPKRPKCTNCPLRSHCLALQHDTVDLRPVVAAKGKKIEIEMACGIIIRQGKVFIQQRMGDDVWGGLWEFPGGRLRAGELPEQAARREIMEETEFSVSGVRFFATVVHHYTKYRVTLHGFICRLHGKNSTPVLHAASRYRWVSVADLSEFPFPAGHRQLVVRLREEGIDLLQSPCRQPD